MSYSNLDIFMKEYESIEAKRTLLPGLPVCIRLDGRAFHNVTKNCLRPFDDELREVMCRVTTALMTECNAVIGYTQSDEITLVLKPMAHISDYYFGGRIQKICSMLSAVASVEFNRIVHTKEDKKEDKKDDAKGETKDGGNSEEEQVPFKMTKNRTPMNMQRTDNEVDFTKLERRIGKRTAYFDCRAWNVPHMDFAALVLSWRQADAIKNSISMVAQSLYPHKELLNKNSDDKMEMIKKKGYAMKWDAKSWPGELFFDKEAMNMQGVFIVRKLMPRQLTKEELENLPPMHKARQNPDMTFLRHEYIRFAGVILRNIKNQAGYLFNGEIPQFRPTEVPTETAATYKFFEMLSFLKTTSPEKRKAAEDGLREAGAWDALKFNDYVALFEVNGQETKKNVEEQ